MHAPNWPFCARPPCPPSQLRAALNRRYVRAESALCNSLSQLQGACLSRYATRERSWSPRAEIIPWTRAPSPGVGAAFTIFCVCSVLMSWQVTVPMTGTGNRSPLGMRVLAGPSLLNREAVRVQVPGDQVRAGTCHVRRAGGQPLGDLLQPGGQLLLAGCLALLPLAVLVPDRPPAAGFLAGRVHGDAVLQLDDLAAPPGGRTAGPAHERPAGLRPSGGPSGLAAGRLWGSWRPRALPASCGFPRFLRFRRQEG